MLDFHKVVRYKITCDIKDFVVKKFNLLRGIEIFQVVYPRKNSYRFVHRITVGTVIMPNAKFSSSTLEEECGGLGCKRSFGVYKNYQEMDVLHFPLQHLVGHILPIILPNNKLITAILPNNITNNRLIKAWFVEWPARNPNCNS